MGAEKITHTEENIGRRRWIFCPTILSLLSFICFVIIMRDSTIIRSDGPSGFGEVAIKGLIMLTTIPAISANVVSAFVAFNVKNRRRIAICTYVMTSAWLVLLSTLSIFDACSDDKGLCRGWVLYLNG